MGLGLSCYGEQVEALTGAFFVDGEPAKRDELLMGADKEARDEMATRFAVALLPRMPIPSTIDGAMSDGSDSVDATVKLYTEFVFRLADAMIRRRDGGNGAASKETT